MLNYHKEALIIMEKLNDQILKSLIFRIVITNPKSLIYAYEELLPTDSHVRGCFVAFLKSTKPTKIEAIKFWRTLTGAGIKEAKDYVDSLGKEYLESLFNGSEFR